VLTAAGGAQVAAVARPLPSVTVSGRVVDAASAAPVADARVELAQSPRGAGVEPRQAQTTARGEFRFERVVPGTYVLTVSSVGYAFVSREIDVGTVIDDLTIPLSEGAGAYRETVTVTSDSRHAAEPGMAPATLGPAALQELRGVTTDDPMRAVQALPGVATGDDFQAGFSVRGSAFRHLGVVIDGVPAPRLLHAVHATGNDGSLAMVSTDVLDHAELGAGPRSRSDGDWLGPTLALAIREGSRDRTGLRAAVSGTAASFVAEGPIGRDARGSWLVSARRSYLDWLIRRLEPDIDSTFGFVDAQAKVVVDLTDRQQAQLVLVGGDAVYRERDASRVNGLARALSGSTLASGTWRRATPGLVATGRAAFLGSEFRNLGAVGQELARGYTQSVSFRSDVVLPAGGDWTIGFGGAHERQRANEIRRRFRAAGAGVVVPTAARDRSPHVGQSSAWVQAVHRTPRGGLTAGVRVARDSRAAGVVASPWLLAERTFGDLVVRAGIGRSAQFPDLLLAPRLGEPLAPERATDAELGVEHWLDDRVSWRIAVFRRAESNGLRLGAEDRIEPTSARHVTGLVFPEHVSALDGTSRGVDAVLARRAAAGLTGWIGYTWATTTMRDAATDETFDGDLDQRHTLNVVASYRASHRTALGAKLRVGSNVPLAGYFDEAGDGLRLAAVRNRVRLPVYARLDLRITRTFTSERRRFTVFAEVMNVLSRRNVGQAPASVRPTLEVTGYAERLMPFVPSVGLLVEF
jgi:hypothetical protein